MTKQDLGCMEPDGKMNDNRTEVRGRLISLWLYKANKLQD
jgi:hypothetical protein